ncbi:MAG TPA: hypothetical protein DCQ50_21095 [Chryseobacterium sp.]|nr:hypothetical protein [Chryseobacterium sp.]
MTNSKRVLITSIAFLLLIQIVNAQRINCKVPYDYTWSDRKFYFEKGNINSPSLDEIEYYLDNIHIGGALDYQLAYYNFNDSNVSEAAKKRILSILKNEWTYKELRWKWKSIKEVHEPAFINKVLQSEDSLRKIYRASNYCSEIKLYNMIYDSLAKPYKVQMLNEINNTPVSNTILLAVGWLNFKQAIPILKAASLSNDKRFDTSTLELVLAKLGEKRNLVKVFDLTPFLSKEKWDNNLIQKVEFQLFYIGTQESISMFNKFMDPTKRCPLHPDDVMNRGYAAAYLIPDLLAIIKNNSFHEIFRGVNYSAGYIDQEALKPEMITKTREWLIANNGKYDINYDWLTYYW